ncbi:MAG TPA: SDR family oxidoreductase [Vicinamibacterales bacterium]|nr:SDR family oxidoreductase [Vicinamibacterales bacterium]
MAKRAQSSTRPLAGRVADAGGTAIAVRVDHTQEPEVEGLFTRVDGEHGRLDVLVNSIAGEDPAIGGYGWVWSADLTNGPAVFRQSLLSHMITAKHAARVMIRDRRGLIVEVTENNVLNAGGNPLAQAVTFGLNSDRMAEHIGAPDQAVPEEAAGSGARSEGLEPKEGVRDAGPRTLR